MPLLHFVGLSNVGKSFSIAFCFLKSELKSDYIWALKAFSACFNKCPDVFVNDYEMALINASYEVFPNTAHLLCIWHINKNVLKNCRLFFESVDEYNSFFNDWKDLIYLNDQSSFEERFDIFKESWKGVPGAIGYIEQNLYPVRHKFVVACTNKFRHFGSTSTSRNEGMHAQIKKYIVSSREDMLGVCNAITLAAEAQLNKINIAIEQQKVSNYFRFDDFFCNVKNKI
jgi:hypothetical protein